MQMRARKASNNSANGNKAQETEDQSQSKSRKKQSKDKQAQRMQAIPLTVRLSRGRIQRHAELARALRVDRDDVHVRVWRSGNDSSGSSGEKRKGNR